jgi:hypothetical protein
VAATLRKAGLPLEAEDFTPPTAIQCRKHFAESWFILPIRRFEPRVGNGPFLEVTPITTLSAAAIAI